MNTDYEDVLERWYRVEISREELKKLMRRSDARGVTRTAAHFAVLAGLGILAYQLIGTWWMFPAFFAYGTVYCFLNHVMHETHHRTPFKTVWINEVVHWIAAFAHGAEPVFDRWGHAQHHTHTYFPEHDPEAAGARPARLPLLIGQFFGFGIIKPLPIIRHAFGDITERARQIVPESDWKKMIWSSRLWLLAYAAIIASCFIFGTILPLVYTLFARFYGAFIPTMLNDTQHVGLEEDVYDHRLCTRNVYYGPVLTFLYWNMQYHIEHHMFPGVPFYALKKLHLKVKHQLPAPYRNILLAYRELIPTVIRQQKDEQFRVIPVCPPDYPAMPDGVDEEEGNDISSDALSLDTEHSWLKVASTDNLDTDDVLPFKHEGMQYAVYHLRDGYYASSGKCTHAGALLAKGLVIDGKIECPAHQGRFDIRSGKATDSPACDHLITYPVKEYEGGLYIGLPLAEVK